MNQVALIKVPAKIMLAGEYSVLNGGSSLTITIDKYFTATFTKITDQKSPTLKSSLWNSEINLDHAPTSLMEEPAVVLAKEINSDLDSKCDIDLQSDFPPSYGFGSSSALRLALNYYLAHEKKSLCPMSIAVKNSVEQQRKFQKKSSGYDIVSQANGGPIEYIVNDDLLATEYYKQNIDEQRVYEYIHIFVGGKGSVTSSELTSMTHWLQTSALIQDLNELNHSLIDSLKGFIHGTTSLASLIDATVKQRKFFEGAPNFPKSVLDAVKDSSGFDKTFSFKTTGSGGEDALIFIGSSSDVSKASRALTHLGWKSIPFKLEFNGLQISEAEND